MKSERIAMSGLMKNVLRGFCAVLLLVSATAFGLELKDAKAQGLVGETDTGYLAAVQASAEVSALVADINAQRKAEYQRIARQNGISLADMEKLAAQKAIEKTPPGHYVSIGGQWQRK